MLITRYLTTLPLLALLIILVACGAQSGAPPAPSAPPAGQDTLQQPGSGGPAEQAPILSGVVRELSADELVLERVDGSSVTVTLSATTAIRQQSEARRADLLPGAQVTVLAEAHEEGLSARLVQLGGAGEPLLVAPGGPAGPGSAPAMLPMGSDAPAAGSRKPQVYAGTVQESGETTLTLQQANGQAVTITLTEQTRYQQETQAEREALRVGALVMAEGTRDGTLFQAVTLRVLGAPEGQ